MIDMDASNNTNDNINDLCKVIQKLIDKYETMLALKESEQKKTQEEAKNIKDSTDYGDEQKKKNIKLHLVRLGAEVRMIKEFISELEKLMKEEEERE